MSGNGVKVAAWEHADRLERLQGGSVLMASEPVRGVDMREGGRLSYSPGARFRFKHALAGLLWCEDEECRSVTFDRIEMQCLDAPQSSPPASPSPPSAT